MCVGLMKCDVDVDVHVRFCTAWPVSVKTSPLHLDSLLADSGKTVDSSIYPIIGIVAGFGTAAIIAIAFFCRRYDGSVS